MPPSRMSLIDGAQALGLTPNGARSRFKAGKIKGERDNRGHIWIWIDEADEGSKRPRKQASIEGASNSSIENPSKVSKASIGDVPKATSVAFEGHIRTLTEQLARAQEEMAALRVRASTADRLEGEVTGLEALRDELRAERDQWRQMAVERQTTPEAAKPRKRGLFGLLSRAA